MNLSVEIVEQFEAAWPRLTSLAHRIVGSHHDAEDLVQAAWLRIQSARQTDLDNPDGWFTTITARLCLDLLRSRERRGEVFRPAAELPGEQLAADEEFLRREDVSRALLILLDRLSPRRRVAYVLHDLFAVPFDQVAAVLGTSTDAAKKLAGRARADLRPAEPARAVVGADHIAIVEAFLAAARGGDIDRLVTMLAPDAVRSADARLLPPERGPRCAVPARSRRRRGISWIGSRSPQQFSWTVARVRSSRRAGIPTLSSASGSAGRRSRMSISRRTRPMS